MKGMGSLKTASKTELKRGDPTRLDTELMVQKTASKYHFMAMHPFENHLYAADRNSFSLWSFGQRSGLADTSSTPNISSPHRSSACHDSTCLIGSQSNNLSDDHKVTSLQLLNPSSNTLVMLASDDGSIKLWSTKIVNKVMSSSFNSSISGSDTGQLRLESKLVSAFTIFGDMATLQSKPVDKFGHKVDTSMTGSTTASAIGSQTPRIILKWEQNNGQLVAGGDYKVIRIWDAMTETKLRDIPTDCITSVSCISSDEDHLICAGCSDGSIRIFDRREPYVQRVRPITFREHTHPIVAAQLFPESSTSPFFVISTSSFGDVKFWDRRMLTSIRTMNVSNEITAMTFHPEADVFAWYASSILSLLYSLHRSEGNNSATFHPLLRSILSLLLLSLLSVSFSSLSQKFTSSFAHCFPNITLS